MIVWQILPFKNLEQVITLNGAQFPADSIFHLAFLKGRGSSHIHPMLDRVTFPGDAGGVIRGSPIVYCGEPNAREKEMEEKKKRFTKS